MWASLRRGEARREAPLSAGPARRLDVALEYSDTARWRETRFSSIPPLAVRLRLALLEHARRRGRADSGVRPSALPEKDARFLGPGALVRYGMRHFGLSRWFRPSVLRPVSDAADGRTGPGGEGQPAPPCPWADVPGEVTSLAAVRGRATLGGWSGWVSPPRKRKRWYGLPPLRKGACSGVSSGKGAGEAYPFLSRPHGIPV